MTKTAYAEMRHASLPGGICASRNRVAVSTAFKITMIEGIEVVFIVVAMGGAGPASSSGGIGAVAALLLVVLLGLLLRRPVAMIPENTLILLAVLLCSFGIRIGEGIGSVAGR